MAFVRTHRRRLRDGSVRVYYEEVESYRHAGKVRQRRLRYLGLSPLPPIPLPPAHLGLLATRLATGATAEEILRFVREMGVELPPTSLQALDIRYDVEKKLCELRLYPLLPSASRRSRAGSARSSPRPTRRASALSRGRDR